MTAPTALAEAALLSVRTTRDFPEIFAPESVLASLGPKEQKTLRDFRAPKRKRQWLLARLTAKELVRRYTALHWDWEPQTQEVQILNRETGAPYITFSPAVASSVLEPLAVTISHSGEVAAVAVTAATPGFSFGIDVQRIEPRYPFFAEEHFSGEECDALRNFPLSAKDAALTAYWSVKESVAKALGIGLRGAIEDVEVVSISAHSEAVVRLKPNAKTSGPPPLALRSKVWWFGEYTLAYSAAWRPPATPPSRSARLEESPVLPGSRQTLIPHP